MSPTRGKTPCLVCGLPTLHGTYCPRHCTHCPEHRDGRAHNPTDPAYRDPEYRRNREALMRRHVAEHGDNWCPGAPDLDHAPHYCDRLTVDHIVPLRLGGTHLPSNLRVLCDEANRARRRR